MKLKILFLLPLIFYFGCVQPLPSETNEEGNQKPVINNLTVDPVFITVGTTTTLKVDAVDPDGDNLNYKWDPAIGDIIGSGPEVRYTAAFCCVGTTRITVTVEDSRGGSVSEDVNLEVNP